MKTELIWKQENSWLPNTLQIRTKTKKNLIYLLNYNETRDRPVKFPPKEQWKYILTRALIKKPHIFGAIHNDILIDLKLDYTVSRSFQEMSLTKFETLPHLYELESSQILQIAQISMVTQETYCGVILVLNKSHYCMSLQTSSVTKEYQFLFLKQRPFHKHTLNTNIVLGYSRPTWIKFLSRRSTTRHKRR